MGHPSHLNGIGCRRPSRLPIKTAGVWSHFGSLSPRIIQIAFVRRFRLLRLKTARILLLPNIRKATNYWRRGRCMGRVCSVAGLGVPSGHSFAPPLYQYVHAVRNQLSCFVAIHNNSFVVRKYVPGRYLQAPMCDNSDSCHDSWGQSSCGFYRQGILTITCSFQM